MGKNINLKRSAALMFSLVIAIVAAYLAILLKVSWPIDELSINKAAVLGDSFGIINSLFSGLAFAGLIVTILLQREELKESRKIFSSQKFEDAFYRLLSFYKENLNDINVHGNEEDGVFKGVGGLSRQLKKFASSIKPYLSYLETDVDVFRFVVYKEAQRVLAPQSRYLGTLESILSLVVAEVKDLDERRFYIKLVASQLTVHEIKYIFYRCLVSPTDSSLVSLVNDTKVIEVRISEANINPGIISFYNCIHGVELPSIKYQYESIYTASEERRIKAVLAKSNEGGAKVS